MTIELFYGFNIENNLENEHEGVIAQNITPKQALNMAKIFANEYGEVKLYDGEFEAFLTVKKDENSPKVYACYDEEYEEVQLKYGLIEKIQKQEAYTNLKDEKWDNYWSDYSQCGVRIDHLG